MNTPHTPREVLLTRHAASGPVLDAQRTALLARFGAGHASSESAMPSSPRAHASATFFPFAFFATLHRELFAPYRRAWSALACVWLGILAFQEIDRLAAPPFAPASDSASNAALLALWLEQRRQLAALAADTGFRASPAPVHETISPPAVTRPLGAVEPTPARLAVA